MRKQLIAIISVTVAVLLLLAIIFFFLLKPKSPNTPAVTTAPSATPTPVISQNDNTYKANQILTWIENNGRDERGAYANTYNCVINNDMTSTCELGGAGNNRFGAAVMWANYNLWKTSNNPAALQRLKNALNTYSNTDVVQVIQTNALSCYYMLPIATDSTLDAADKQKAAQICVRTANESGISDWSTAETSDVYIEQINTALASLTQGETGATVTTILDATPGVTWNSYATDAVARYQLRNQNDYVNVSSSSFQIISPINSMSSGYVYYLGALQPYLTNTSLLSDLETGCPLLLASQSFCNLNTDPTTTASCALAQSLIPKLRSADTTGNDYTYNSLEECVLATTGEDRAYFLSLLNGGYDSADNDFYQPEEVRLLNNRGGLTKIISENAVYAGLLAE